MADARLPDGISGTCDARFAAIPEILARHIGEDRHHGAAVSVFHRGEPVVDIWGGRRHLLGGGEAPWEEDTVVLSFSTTKGITATAAHMALERAGVPYDTPVVDVWPTFAEQPSALAGPFDKRATTIRHLLCHEAGLPQIVDVVDDVTDLEDWERVVRGLEAIPPLWEPGSANGYHAVTFGFLVGEVLRRVDPAGRRIDHFVREEIAEPLGLDGLFFGLPADQHHRAAVVETAGGSAQDVMDALAIPPDHLLRLTLDPPGDSPSWLTSPAGISTCAPSHTGSFTARSVAAVYAALSEGGGLGGVQLLEPGTLAKALEVQNRRADLVLFVPCHWRLGWSSGGNEIAFAGPNREAFGHSGLGGSVGMGDPKARVAVAVTLDRLEQNLLADDRARSIVQAAVAAAEAA